MSITPFPFQPCLNLTNQVGDLTSPTKWGNYYLAHPPNALTLMWFPPNAFFPLLNPVLCVLSSAVVLY